MICISESVSRDSGLGFESGGVDNLSNGLNSMGLGGRGFPSYGNQGFVNIWYRSSKQSYEFSVKDSLEEDLVVSQVALEVYLVWDQTLQHLEGCLNQGKLEYYQLLFDWQPWPCLFQNDKGLDSLPPGAPGKTC